MAFRDQQKYLDALRRYERKFNREENEMYKMFQKMHKDEEDFDSISLKKLKDLYDKYYVPADRTKLENLFNYIIPWFNMNFLHQCTMYIYSCIFVVPHHAH